MRADMRVIRAAVIGAALLVGPLAFGGSFDQQCVRPGQGTANSAGTPAAQTNQERLGATLGPDTGTQTGIGTGTATGVGTATGTGGAGTAATPGELSGGLTSCHCQAVPGAANTQAPGADSCIRVQDGQP